MNTLGNKRFLETDHKIREAFLSLLERKPIDGLSVNEICKAANISRPSFYSHYEDINDLILKIESEKSSYIGTLLTTASPLSLRDFICYLNYIKANKHFYTAYFKSENGSHVSEHMMQQYLSSNRIQYTPLLKYWMLFFMSGLKSVVSDWLEQNCQETVEQLAQILMEQYLLFIQTCSSF